MWQCLVILYIIIFGIPQTFVISIEICFLVHDLIPPWNFWLALILPAPILMYFLKHVFSLVTQKHHSNNLQSSSKSKSNLQLDSKTFGLDRLFHSNDFLKSLKWEIFRHVHRLSLALCSIFIADSSLNSW